MLAAVALQVFRTWSYERVRGQYTVEFGHHFLSLPVGPVGEHEIEKFFRGK